MKLLYFCDQSPEEGRDPRGPGADGKAQAHGFSLVGYIRYDCRLLYYWTRKCSRIRISDGSMCAFRAVQASQEASAGPAGPAFCPSFSKHVSLRTMETMRGAVLSSNADADVEVSQEAVFSTACPGRAVYDHFVRLNPAAPHIYFKDDFEELICLSDRKLLETEKKILASPSTSLCRRLPKRTRPALPHVPKPVPRRALWSAGGVLSP